MIYGLPNTTFVVAFGLPVAIVIVLLIWGKLYTVGEDD